jgi:hypothetical protein
VKELIPITAPIVVDVPAVLTVANKVEKVPVVAKVALVQEVSSAVGMDQPPSNNAKEEQDELALFFSSIENGKEIAQALRSQGVVRVRSLHKLRAQTSVQLKRIFGLSANNALILHHVLRTHETFASSAQ